MSAIEKPQPFELTPAWIEKIRQAAPKRPTAQPRAGRRALMFSLCKGFQHWVTPHTSAMVNVLAEQSGAFQAVETADIEDFAPERLAAFDGIILNNTCPVHPRRAFFSDYAPDEARAEELKESVLSFVARGGGLAAIHGGGLAYMNCPKWEAMQGASFDYHPPQQVVTLTAVEPAHPLVQAFGGEPFVHYDEPYLFTNKYAPRSYRPLLAMDIRGMIWRKDKPVPTQTCHVAWIRRHGQGRFFYCSPSHNAQSFESPQLLRFILDGIQYALGDLKCDDAPVP